jgi:hypothetical protein
MLNVHYDEGKSRQTMWMNIHLTLLKAVNAERHIDSTFEMIYATSFTRMQILAQEHSFI